MHRARHYLVQQRLLIFISSSHPPLLNTCNRHSGATSNNRKFPESVGFEEATEAGDDYLMLARALLTDRLMLLIPAWVYVACLVLAAALARVSLERGLFFCCISCLVCVEAREQAVLLLRLSSPFFLLLLFSCVKLTPIRNLEQPKTHPTLQYGVRQTGNADVAA